MTPKWSEATADSEQCLWWFRTLHRMPARVEGVRIFIGEDGTIVAVVRAAVEVITRLANRATLRAQDAQSPRSDRRDGTPLLRP